jgi:hypothetical protein
MRTQTTLVSSPLPGNANLVDEYIQLLPELVCTDILRDTAIRALGQEHAHLTSLLSSLPGEEAELLTVVAHDFASGIQADMETLVRCESAYFSSIQFAIDARQAIAQVARTALPK